MFLLAAEVSGLGAGLIEIAGSVLALVLSALAVGAYRAFTKRTKFEADDRVEQLIRTGVNTAVNAAEQYAKRKWGDQVDKGAEKLSLAKQIAKSNLGRVGVSITDEELEAAIEAEVGVLNSFGRLSGKLGAALED